MTADFQKGLITGLAMQPLQVTTEHAIPDPDAPDIYNIKFESHNIFTDSGILLSSGEWGVSVIGDTATLNINADVTEGWYTMSSPFELETGCLYKLTSSNSRFYGRFGISTYGPGDAIYANEGLNCTCAFKHGDNHMLTNLGDTESGLRSTIFMVIPRTVRALSQTVNFMWCSDKPFNNAKDACSVNVGLYKQVL